MSYNQASRLYRLVEEKRGSTDQMCRLFLTPVILRKAELKALTVGDIIPLDAPALRIDVYSGERLVSQGYPRDSLRKYRLSGEGMQNVQSPHKNAVMIEAGEMEAREIYPGKLLKISKGTRLRLLRDGKTVAYASLLVKGSSCALLIDSF